MDPELFTADDLPADARRLIEEAEHEIDEIRAQSETEVAEVRERAERAMEEIRERADRTATETQEHADREVRKRIRDLLDQLKPLQAACLKRGQLDEALAIRDRSRRLRARLLNVRPDPGNLAVFEREQDGTELLFEVTGSSDSGIWGSDIYTSDSNLAAAAVHSGVLREGERGIVRVTIVDALNVAFTGSERNGIWSEDFGEYPVGYRVSRP
jgi:ElaB/YqjD/DUF883 family membrane-anchored ribosome-binding protein